MALMLAGSVMLTPPVGNRVRCSLETWTRPLPFAPGPVVVPKLPVEEPLLLPVSRSSFPPGFIFGAASSAYQIEGAANEGGRGPSIWDTFTHNHPEKIANHSNGDIAIDSYNRYKEDVEIMKEMGFDSYRFSISWSRILPLYEGGVNEEGIQYYHNLINEIKSKGMVPCVTLFHWDLPQALEDAYGVFLSDKIVEDFRGLADICFREYGDNVKHWITVNEPWTFSSNGAFAPGRCSKWVGECRVGDSATEPYIVTHNLLLAHAAAVKQCKTTYLPYQMGHIGLTLNCHWMKPYDISNIHDTRVADRALDFMFGWYMKPVTRGEYPFTMRQNVGSRLPDFTKDQSNMLEGSYDFVGVNYYTAYYAQDNSRSSDFVKSYANDQRSTLRGDKDGAPIGPEAGSSWLRVYPQGIKDLLLHTKEKYNNPVIYITENGVDEKNDESLPLQEALKDDMRVKYYSDHILKVQEAIREGIDVRGYFAWSILDNFEWAEGYNVRFGLIYVDYKDNLKGHPKDSAAWFKKFLEN